MSKFYRFFTSDKIKFLDDILFQLEKEPIEQNEDNIAPIVCFKDSKPDKIFGSFRITKKFIPEGKERKYFRIAVNYLEREKYVSIIPTNPAIPNYIINYEGIVLVRNGGLSKKIFLDKVTGVLQRTAWLVIFLTFLFNVLLQLNLLEPINRSEEKSPSKIKPKIEENSNQIHSDDSNQIFKKKMSLDSVSIK